MSHDRFLCLAVDARELPNQAPGRTRNSAPLSFRVNPIRAQWAFVRGSM
jgi:hypothetical protein